jgi:ADP-ribose diphosphatase
MIVVMSEHDEKILEERVAYKGRLFSVVERDIEIKPGKTVTWEMISTGGDAVGIVAIDADQNIYLVEEYFAAVHERGLKLPGGKIDDGEEPETAANRELQEEIGFTGDFSKLADMTTAPGYIIHRTVIYLAENLKSSSLEGDEKHHFRVHKLPLHKAVAMCASGEIAEARTVAALLLAEKKLS